MLDYPVPVPWVLPFMGFTDFTPAVPQLYWNVDSAEQRYHLLCKLLHKSICYDDYLAGKIQLNRDDIDGLMAEFEKFQKSGFDDYYREQVIAWIKANLEYIYRYTIKQIIFGLDDTGHLIAWIPESWEQIVFSTPMDYSDQRTYGRLVLSYDVEP